MKKLKFLGGGGGGGGGGGASPEQVKGEEPMTTGRSPEIPQTGAAEGAEVLVGNGAQRRATSDDASELEELLLKLDLMEKECVQEKLVEEKEAMKDEFIALKRAMYKSLMETKELIRFRYQAQLKKGQTIDVIQKGALINNKLEGLDADFRKMKEVFKKQVKQKGKKYSESQLDQRFQEMQLIKQQIEESRSLLRNAAAYSEAEVKTLTDFRSQMGQQGVTLPQDWREPTSDEQATIDKWRGRDQEIDVQVGEIGDAIDRLGELALHIGEKADKQSQLVAGLHQQADETNEDLININNRLKTLIEKQGGMNFFCKLLMTLVLIGLIGYIISAINRRIIG